MVSVANVYAWGMYVGAVLWDDSKGVAAFEYDPAFCRKGIELSPLMMPAEAGRTYRFPSLGGDTFMGLPGMLADALPDSYGTALLDSWLSSQGRTLANPVERLCYQGSRAMGALEFVPSTALGLDGASPLEVDSLVRVAAEVLGERRSMEVNLKEDAAEALLNIIRVGTSAGGQRAKAVIAYNENTGEVRSGQAEAPEGFNHWLLKLDGVTNRVLGDPSQYGRIEYAYYLMAQKAGIEMTQCRLLEENGRAHFMTRRFDRFGSGGRIHSSTLCGMVYADYRRLRAYSYEQAFGVMRRLRLPYPDMVQMYRRMVFNVLAWNNDDHTKNISFIMPKGGRWRLSPAYDMTYAFNPKGMWTSAHQMSVNGKWDNIGRDDLLAVASSVGISGAATLIDQVADAVAQWPSIASSCGLPESSSKAIWSVIRP